MKPIHWKLLAGGVAAAFVVFALRAIPKRTVTFDTDAGMIISGTSTTVVGVAGKPIEDLTGPELADLLTRE